VCVFAEDSGRPPRVCVFGDLVGIIGIIMRSFGGTGVQNGDWVVGRFRSTERGVEERGREGKSERGRGWGSLRCITACGRCSMDSILDRLTERRAVVVLTRSSGSASGRGRWSTDGHRRRDRLLGRVIDARVSSRTRAGHFAVEHRITPLSSGAGEARLDSIQLHTGLGGGALGGVGANHADVGNGNVLSEVARGKGRGGKGQGEKDGGLHHDLCSVRRGVLGFSEYMG